MTYLFLAIALLGILPVVLLVTADSRALRKMAWAAVLLPVLFLCASAVNTFSELKYVLFGGAVLLAIPIVPMLVVERRWIRWVVMAGLLLPAAVYQATAVNFFSREYYTGTSRGMEVSLVYLAAALLLLVC